MYRQLLPTLKHIQVGNASSRLPQSALGILPQIQPARNGSYFKSKLEGSPEKYTDVEKSYAEWKYVEKLLPNKYVPEPPQEYTMHPSGWRPQKADLNLPYHVPRTRNHMLPVYYKSIERGQKQWTLIRHVEGNIWALEREVGQFLKSKYPDKTIMTYVHECSRWINVRGDHEAEIKEWLLEKGF